jgi:hypothetical protein
MPCTREEAPNLATRIVALPIEIRDRIWCIYFEDCLKAKKVSPRQWYSRDYEESGCTHKLLELTGRKYRPKYKDQTAILHVTMKMGCDVERFLYSELEHVWFCNEKCFTNYLKTTRVLGPLRWTPIIKLWLENVTEAKAHGAAVTALQSLRLLHKRMQMTLGGVDESSDWKVEVGSPKAGAKLRKDKQTWNHLQVVLSR